MRLFELFAMDEDDNSGDMQTSLRNDAIDMLMPLAAQGVPFVTVQAVQQKLGQNGSGIDIDRNMIMTLLDPNEVKLVTKIEGDKIYFQIPDADSRKVDDTQKVKDAEKTADKGTKQAVKKVQASSNPLA
jgi:hypothetical protein